MKYLIKKNNKKITGFFYFGEENALQMVSPCILLQALVNNLTNIERNKVRN